MESKKHNFCSLAFSFFYEVIVRIDFQIWKHIQIPGMEMYAEIQIFMDIMWAGFARADVQLWETGVKHHFVTTLAQHSLVELVDP